MENETTKNISPLEQLTLCLLMDKEKRKNIYTNFIYEAVNLKPIAKYNTIKVDVMNILNSN